MSGNPVSRMLREGLYTRVVGRRLVYHKRLFSTMDEAKRRAQEGVEEGTVILAEEQTGGRGRFDRQWVSEPGNLYFSVVLQPSLHGLPYISVISGVAVARAVRKSLGLTPTIKWPNDVRIRGKKLCGILVESSIQDSLVQYAIMGIGINVSLDPSATPDLGEIATSLNIEAGRSVYREEILRNVLQEMDKLYLPLRETVGSTQTNDSVNVEDQWTIHEALDEWRTLLETLGQRVEVRWGDEVHAGLAEDVDAMGNLLLRTSEGTLLTLPAGEVTSSVAEARGED